MRPPDCIGVFYDAGARDTCRDHVECDGGADDVGCIDDCGAQGACAENDYAVWIAYSDVRSEFGEFVHPAKAAFVDLVPKLHRAFGAHCERNHAGEQVDGEVGPGGGFDARKQVGREGGGDAEGLACADERGVGFVFDRDAEFTEGAPNEVEVLGDSVAHPYFAAGDGSEREEGDDFVMVRIDGKGAAVESLDSVDDELAGADAINLCTHADEHLAKVLDMGFARGVDEDGLALGKDSGHCEVFRCRD